MDAAGGGAGGQACPRRHPHRAHLGQHGIGLAAIGASRGYRVILTMPETMSRERRDLLKAYGAQIVLTPGDKGMDGAMQKAAELAASLPGSFIPGQFENPHNAQAHYESTGPELWEQAGGALDAFVAGIGTGGTLTGTGRFLREKNPDIALVGVEPAGSPVLDPGQGRAPRAPGHRAGFVPQVLDTGLYDEVLPCTEEDAYAAARELARTEGILVGISSGAALWAACQVAARPAYQGKTVAVLLPIPATGTCPRRFSGNNHGRGHHDFGPIGGGEDHLGQAHRPAAGPGLLRYRRVYLAKGYTQALHRHVFPGGEGCPAATGRLPGGAVCHGGLHGFLPPAL